MLGCELSVQLAVCAYVRKHSRIVIDKMVNSSVVSGNINAVATSVGGIQRMVSQHVSKRVFAKERNPFNHFSFHLWRQLASHLIETFMKDNVHKDLRWVAISSGFVRIFETFLLLLRSAIASLSSCSISGFKRGNADTVNERLRTNSFKLAVITVVNGTPISSARSWASCFSALLTFILMMVLSKVLIYHSIYSGIRFVKCFSILSDSNWNNREGYETKNPENKFWNFSNLFLRLVAPPRLELGTQGSSGLCSTN